MTVLRVISVTLSLISSLFLLFLFGYLELTHSSGCIVTSLVGAFVLMFCTDSFLWQLIVTAIVAAQMLSSLLAIKSMKIALFVLLDVLFVFLRKGPVTPTDDTDVVMRPYEAEIRGLLWREDPSILHKVDTMLEKYRGREQVLYDELCQQYSRSNTPSGSAISPSTPLLASYEYGHTPVVGTGTRATHSAIQGGVVKLPTTSFKQKRAQVAASVAHIESILKQYDPRMLHSLDAMLMEYEGREEDLLREVRAEYGLAADGTKAASASSSSTKVSAAVSNGDGFGSAPMAMTQIGYCSSSSRIAVDDLSFERSPFSSTTPVNTSGSYRQQIPNAMNSLGNNDKSGDKMLIQRRLSSGSHGGILAPTRHSSTPFSPSSESTSKKSVDVDNSLRNRERDLAVEQARLEVQRGIQARINARWGVPK
jgi:hypothetical protein